MAKYTYINSNKRRVDHKRVSIALLVVAVIAVGGVMTYGYVVTNNIKTIQNDNETTQQVIKEMEQKVTDIQEANTSKLEEIKGLEDLLWRYEPVVIPDSMK